LLQLTFRTLIFETPQSTKQAWAEPVMVKSVTLELLTPKNSMVWLWGLPLASELSNVPGPSMRELDVFVDEIRSPLLDPVHVIVELLRISAQFEGRVTVPDTE
jgi:hypothetical protein